MKSTVVIGLAALGLGLTLIGCARNDAAKPGAAIPVSSTPGDAAITWVSVTDPVEKAFTIDLPAGWKNDAYLKRHGVVTVNVATTESPDGATALFYGDPKMPHFVEPAAATPFSQNDPMTRVQSYTPATRFLPDYLRKRFGTLPGFRVDAVTPEPELVRKNRDAAAKAGFPLAQLDSARVDFTFEDGGKSRRASVFGTTYGTNLIWMASVAGIISTDDPSRFRDALFHILESQKATAEWKEQERIAAADRQAQHERVMRQIALNTEILRQNHRNNMATLNGMAARHQLRMDAIHAAGDASMAAYRARDVASDHTQRGFLNYITEEHTVATPGGRTFQVDNQYDRYYINKNDNTYIGVKGGTDLNQLNGVNPADYEEARIQR